LSRLFHACVTDNVEVAQDNYLLTLSPLDTIQTPVPGNFFMLSIDKGYDPLLKRPFSIHRCAGGTLQILYRVVGKGTLILSRKKPGDVIEAVGPLGNAFPVRKGMKDIILVAGGLGIAPIFALAEKIVSMNSSPRSGGSEPLLFYGARTKDELLCMHELSSLGIDPVISTDDGTAGRKGNIIAVLKKHLARRRSAGVLPTLFACGPGPMLKSLASVTVKKGLKGYAALEQNMACGLGTCLGCIVLTKTGYKRVCKEGPVFPLGDIVWE